MPLYKNNSVEHENTIWNHINYYLADNGSPNVYTSCWRLEGFRSSSTSLKTPPKQPVMTPMTIATKDNRQTMFFPIPSMVNTLTPIMSNTKNDLLNFFTYLPKRTTKSRAINVPDQIPSWSIQRSYIQEHISKGSPPMAVLNRLRTAPNQWYCFSDAILNTAYGKSKA